MLPDNARPCWPWQEWLNVATCSCSAQATITKRGDGDCLVRSMPSAWQGSKFSFNTFNLSLLFKHFNSKSWCVMERVWCMKYFMRIEDEKPTWVSHKTDNESISWLEKWGGREEREGREISSLHWQNKYKLHEIFKWPSVATTVYSKVLEYVLFQKATLRRRIHSSRMRFYSFPSLQRR